jgi:hypothetical protein
MHPLRARNGRPTAAERRRTLHRQSRDRAVALASAGCTCPAFSPSASRWLDACANSEAVLADTRAVRRGRARSGQHAGARGDRRGYAHLVPGSGLARRRSRDARPAGGAFGLPDHGAHHRAVPERLGHAVGREPVLAAARAAVSQARAPAPRLAAVRPVRRILARGHPRTGPGRQRRDAVVGRLSSKGAVPNGESCWRRSRRSQCDR